MLTRLPYILLFCLLSALSIACNGDDDAAPAVVYDPPTWPDYETTPATGTPQEQIDRFVAANNLDTVVTPSGLVYAITDSGDLSAEDPTPNSSSTVLVFYRGALVDGRIFDQASSTPTGLGLSRLIPAWQEALPLIGRGGQQLLLVRPSLGYGPNGNPQAGITGSSVLVFDIKMEDFQ